MHFLSQYCLTAMLLVVLVPLGAAAEPCDLAFGGEAAAREEIIGLILEKDSLKPGQDPSLWLLLEGSIRQKLDEYSRVYGQAFGPQEVREAVADASRVRNQANRVQQESVSEVRVRERESVYPFEVMPGRHFSPSSLDASDLHWTFDDRFLLIRPNSGENTVIYDFVDRKILDIDVSQGFFLPKTHHIVFYSSSKEFYIRDLDSDRVWGPFAGWPKFEYCTSNELVAMIKDEWIVYDFRNNREFSLRKEFVARKEDGTVLGFRSGPSEVSFFDVRSWSIVHRLTVQPQQMQTSPATDFFGYQESGRGSSRVLSLVNFKEYLAKRDSEVARLGSGALIGSSSYKYKDRKRFELSVLDSGKPYEVTGADGFEASPDGTKLNFYSSDGPSKLLDLVTHKTLELKNRLRLFSHDGRWLWGYSMATSGQVLYEIATGLEIELPDRASDFEILPNSEFAITVSGGGRVFINRTRELNENPYQFEIGEDRVYGTSPSGRYVLSIAKGRLLSQPLW